MAEDVVAGEQPPGSPSSPGVPPSPVPVTQVTVAVPVTQVTAAVPVTQVTVAVPVTQVTAAVPVVPARSRFMGTGSLSRSVIRALPRPTDTPFTFWYLIVLALTTMLLDFAKPSAAHRLLALSSTNAMNLQTHPLEVLFLSALWLDGQHWLIYATIFTVVIAPLERRIGSWWTWLVFASGHVLATLATELPVLWAIKAHLLPHNDAHLLDIGVSYGLAATAGALLLLLATPARWWATSALMAAILAAYLYMGLGDTDSIVTTAGHLTAGAIGMLGWYPWLRKRGLVGSLRLPSLRTRTLAPVLATGA